LIRDSVLRYYGEAKMIGDKLVLESICVGDIITNKVWVYGGKTYSVRGLKVKEGVNRYEKCHEIIINIIKKIGVHKPKDLRLRDISAFSYFFDRSADLGLIDAMVGGTLKVRHFIDSAKYNCANPNIDQPMLCLDLTYISTLLQEAYGLDPSTKIHLHKKINGHETSWALGAAFQLLENKL